MPQLTEVSDKRSRTRTGCLTCRQRRIKCDETKPACLRCHKANVVCAGYEPRRQAIEEPMQQPNGLDIQPSIRQSIHQRAGGVLGFDQYVHRTSALISDADHLWYWRDHIVDASYTCECLFDAVLALGMTDKALQLQPAHSKGNHPLIRQLKEMATACFASSKKIVCSADFSDDGLTDDNRVAAYIILAYHQWLNNDAASAFRMLVNAKQSFASASIIAQSMDAPLRASIRHLDLKSKSLLTQLITAIGPSISPNSIISPTEEQQRSLNQEIKALRTIVSRDDLIHIAIWKPFSVYGSEVATEYFGNFHNQLSQWQTQTRHVFQHYDTSIISASYSEPSSASLSQLAMPPVPQALGEVETAMALATYHAYMARVLTVLSMLSEGATDSQDHEVRAYLHIYELLRVVAGVVKDGSHETETAYGQRDSVKMSLSSLLCLVAPFVYDFNSREYLAQKLSHIGSDGLDNGTAYSHCWRVWQRIERDAYPSPEQAKRMPAISSHSPLGPLAYRVIPIMFWSAAGTGEHVVYYVQGEATQLQIGRRVILARASWTYGSDGILYYDQTEIIDPDAEINQQLGSGCVYEFLAGAEPLAAEWFTALAALPPRLCRAFETSEGRPVS